MNMVIVNFNLNGNGTAHFKKVYNLINCRDETDLLINQINLLSNSVTNPARIIALRFSGLHSFFKTVMPLYQGSRILNCFGVRFGSGLIYPTTMNVKYTY